jgi:hypothetical protein
VTGTLATAAQPNITSVGTLTSLQVSGNITPIADQVYNLGNATNAFKDLYLSGTTIYLGNSGATITANASSVIITSPGGNSVPMKPGGANTQIQYNDDGIFGGNPAFTFDEGLTRLTANNFVATSTANLGSNANVTITGGSNGQFLTTNGSGTLSWTTGSGGGSYGDSNVVTLLGSFGSNSISTTGNVTAKYLINSVQAGITAAGSAQGNATVLGNTINIVTTVTLGTGVILPSPVAGMTIYITNTSANSLLVYPAVGNAINSLGTNNSFSQPAAATLHYIASSTSQWYTVGATYA